MDLPDLKASLRKEAFAARKQAHQAGLDDAANAALLKTVRGFSGCQIVAGYMPIRTEVSPLPTMSALHAAGYGIAVPVIMAEATPLRWALWRPDTPMVSGAFGAQIPQNPDYVTPDLLICPLVAFDASGARLGYGGGFYDRSLAELRALRPTVAVGFAYSAQEVTTVPQEPTDLPLDCIVTELGCRDF